MRAFSYLRVSGLSQVSGDGIKRQRDSVEKYAVLQSIGIEQEFRDEGVSGKCEGFDRPALSALVSALRDSDIRLVLVERADRLARDLMVGEIILAEFRKLGVNIIETEGGTELTVENGEPTRVLIRQILGAVAQFEKTVIVHKMRAARERIRATGARCEGGKPFGELDGEGLVKEIILAKRGAMKTMVEIATELNSEGVKTRMGKRWHVTSVRRVIDRMETVKNVLGRAG